ncbi:hypothetical protein [Aliiroseovarius sp. PrR006]|uniref:hypothetical protein n=1 Tax=Aliiroseovarius sp. PrR006 TaxID=2706883 RepID=UPI0013D30407|nr:hypothetical protein [Aliiroseovarius sp. PrR006]NDW53609.1 hypothetical protein [Aliiroseovarius sp. PrR006]
MNVLELQNCLNRLEANHRTQSTQERLKIAQLLMQSASSYVQRLRTELREDGAAASRRKAKRRETELDPKPPVKPVRVAEPSKPRKPKYSGNHAPSAPKR